MADQPEADNAPLLELNMKLLRFNVTEHPTLGAGLEIGFPHGSLEVFTHPSQFGVLSEFFKKAQELDWDDATMANKDFWHALATHEASDAWYAEYKAEHEAKGQVFPSAALKGQDEKPVEDPE